MNKHLHTEFKKVSLEDLDYISKELIALMEKPTLLILTGDLGAGKTTLSKSLITNIHAKLGVEEGEVLSPTYSLINSYPQLIHADLYRLEDYEELEYLEIPLYQKYYLVEWGESYIDYFDELLPESVFFYQLFIHQSSEYFRHYQLFQINRLTQE